MSNVLPNKFKLTPEKEAEIAEQQQEWSVNSPFASVSPFQREMTANLIFIRDMEQAISDGFKADNGFKSRLAEAYAATGNYAKAVKSEPDKDKRREYLNILEAIEKDDTELCECETQKGDVELGTHFVKANIWSPKHNTIMPMVACSQCGFENVRELPPEVRKLKDARKQARSLIGNASKETAKMLLESNKLTTKQVLR